MMFAFETGQPEDLEELAKHLNDLGGSDAPQAKSAASGPSQRKPLPPPAVDSDDDEDEGPMRDDGTLPAPDVAPL